MDEKRLNIINDENSKESLLSKKDLTYSAKRLETEARYDRLWLVNPNHMNPMRNCKERERIRRTLNLINSTLPLQNTLAVDLGCASGEVSRRLRDAGAKVDAIDISSIALKMLKEKDSTNITGIQDYVPSTKLQDDKYNLVVSTELIALLAPKQHRLFFSELARLVKSDGYVVSSTQLDINSEDPLERFKALAETELEIQQWVFSYHLYHIRLEDFFKSPSRLVRGYFDKEYRRRELDGRSGFNRWWFRLNSTKFLLPIWYVLQYLFKPIVYLFEQNRSLLLALEKFCHFFSNDAGISHAIFIAKRRPSSFPLPASEIPKEMKHKKQVWE
jgi:2-polyprenyl-3-methyl-5-hydroxy-6-metoxy-1,4-benzoquinol methylase